MKKLLSLLFLTFFLLNMSQAQEYIVSLKDQKLNNCFPNRYISEVYLVQPEDSCIGLITKGVVKTTTPVYFEKNIKDEISDFLMRSMPKKEGTTPLILRINRFYLHTIHKHDNLHACIELSITFITVQDSVYFEEFTAQTTATKFYFDAEQTIPFLVKEAFDQCFSRYSERLQKGLIVPLLVNEQQINENPLVQPGHYQCSIHKERKKGIYLSFYDFRDNLVDTNFHFTIHHNYNNDNPDLTRTHLKYKGGSPPETIWGFSDGDGDFIKVGSSFCRLTLDSNIFYTYTRSSEYAQDITSSAIFGGLFFGVVGAALLGGLTAATTNSKYIIKTKVDPYYGKLVPFETGDYTRIASAVVLYYSKLSVPDVTLSVWVDGREKCILTPDTYLKMDFSCHYSEAIITLVASNGARSVQVIPLELNKTKVYLVKLFNDRTFMFNKLHDQMKTDYLNKKKPENTKCSVNL
jgi:hypothetical protein